MTKVTAKNLAVGDMIVMTVKSGGGQMQHGFPFVIMARTENVVRYHKFQFTKDGSKHFDEEQKVHPGILEQRSYYHVYAK